MVYRKNKTIKKSKRKYIGGGGEEKEIEYDENDFIFQNTEGKDNKCLYYAFFRCKFGDLNKTNKELSNETRYNIQQINEAVYNYVLDNRDEFTEEDIRIADPKSKKYQTDAHVRALAKSQNTIILVHEWNGPRQKEFPHFTVFEPQELDKKKEHTIIFMSNRTNNHYTALIPKDEEIYKKYAKLVKGRTISTEEIRNTKPFFGTDYETTSHSYIKGIPLLRSKEPENASSEIQQINFGNLGDSDASTDKSMPSPQLPLQQFTSRPPTMFTRRERIAQGKAALTASMKAAEPQPRRAAAAAAVADKAREEDERMREIVARVKAAEEALAAAVRAAAETGEAADITEAELKRRKKTEKQWTDMKGWISGVNISLEWPSEESLVAVTKWSKAVKEEEAARDEMARAAAREAIIKARDYYRSLFIIYIMKISIGKGMLKKELMELIESKNKEIESLSDKTMLDLGIRQNANSFEEDRYNYWAHKQNKQLAPAPAAPAVAPPPSLAVAPPPAAAPAPPPAPAAPAAPAPAVAPAPAPAAAPPAAAPPPSPVAAPAAAPLDLPIRRVQLKVDIVTDKEELIELLKQDSEFSKNQKAARNFRILDNWEDLSIGNNYKYRGEIYYHPQRDKYPDNYSDGKQMDLKTDGKHTSRIINGKKILQVTSSESKSKSKYTLGIRKKSTPALKLGKRAETPIRFSYTGIDPANPDEYLAESIAEITNTKKDDRKEEDKPKLELPPVVSSLANNINNTGNVLSLFEPLPVLVGLVAMGVIFILR